MRKLFSLEMEVFPEFNVEHCGETVTSSCELVGNFGYIICNTSSVYKMCVHVEVVEYI